MKNNLSIFSWKDLRWGAWALLCLYISILSGIIVGLQYDYSTPFHSSTSIDLLVPYGRYFRSLHFYSSQFFFLLSCIHLWAVYNKIEKFSWQEWIKLTGTLPAILLLLFTGYVLRGDITGASAGAIAENIIQTVPILGSALDSLFFSISVTGLRKVYIHHIITLDFFLLIIAWNHLWVYRIKIIDHLVAIALVLIFSIFISAPLDGETAGVIYISGPWFFLGLQELLRYLHPLMAGIIFPILFILALFTAHPVTNEKYRYSLWVIVVSLAFYTLLTTIAWNR